MVAAVAAAEVEEEAEAAAVVEVGSVAPEAQAGHRLAHTAMQAPA